MTQKKTSISQKSAFAFLKIILDVIINSIGRITKYRLTIWIASLVIGNSFSPIVAQANDTLQYLFLGHSYQYGSSGNRVDSRIENMNLEQFDRIWLGGDICSEASLNYSTIAYLDELFDLGKSGNHWAFGNHDIRNGNIEWIEEFTERPTFYAYHEKGITTLVLNTNISPLDCENLDKQFQMIENVCDTISSGYLILLVHHGIYSSVPGVANPNSYSHSNLKNWRANCYDNEASYLQAIYPLLVMVENKGVEVLHIMGDVGYEIKSYYGISDHGIEYFGSGIGNSRNTNLGLPIVSPDLLLLFTHILPSNELSWEFIELNKF